MFKNIEHKMFLLFSSFFLLFVLLTPAEAQKLPILSDILVMSPRNMSVLSGSGANIHILTGEDFERLNAHSLREVLETIPSINLIERGTPGSQADIKIRGSSIDGVLLLINGIRVHDPQTGHFTMDIPFELSSVERIEIITGGGSSIYGSSTSGGIINIVTNKDSDGINGGVSFGSYGSANSGLTFSKQLSQSSFSLSLRSGRSDGYKKSSELDMTGVDATGSLEYDDLSVIWNVGFMDRRFGAGDFYAPYPSFEKTLTVQGGINIVRAVNDKSVVRFGIGSRGHKDDFILIKNKPEVYRNTHYNRSSIVTAEYFSNLYDRLYTLVGAETEHMGITSGSLGSHSDYNNAVYGELSARVKKSDMLISMRLDSGYMDESILSPGIAVMVPLKDGIRFNVNAERSFRQPTYTDLYYISPANMGNPSLKSEHSTLFSTGFDLTGKRKEFGISFFARESTDVIDWVRDTGESVWNVANHGSLMTNGVEMKFQFNIFKQWESGFNAVILNQTVKRRKGIESKYSLNPLATILTSTLTGNVFKNIRCTLVARYEDQLRGGSRNPVTFRISKRFAKINAVLSARNMFNERYDEIPGLPAPGRWLNLNIEYAR